MKQVSLRPHDVAIALELAMHPGEGFVPLARAVDLSLSEAHGAVERLVTAKLLSHEERRIRGTALLDFLVSGVPHAFPAVIGPETRGVPTAATAEPLTREFPNAVRYVWPAAQGRERGQALTPLYPKAVQAAGRQPALHALLALVDAVRAGSARERNRAVEMLRERLAGSKES